ncbi:hypothetical protein FRC12_013243 [Ceratobasidium sp. 428]|nr:hypothetical protein FRC12_013243 [Ceratobasidium sp. 428]
MKGGVWVWTFDSADLVGPILNFETSTYIFFFRADARTPLLSQTSIPTSNSTHADAGVVRGYMEISPASFQPARNAVVWMNKLPNPAAQTRDPAASVMTTWLLPLISLAHSTARPLHKLAPSSVPHPSLTSILPTIRCVCPPARDDELKQAWISYATFCGLDGDSEDESGWMRGTCGAALGGLRKHEELGSMEGIRDEER